MQQRVTISISGELAAALDAVARRRSESRSAVVEMLLREHTLVQEAVRAVRGGDAEPAGNKP